jgi:phosphonate transport system ATP-binding protein
VTFRLDAVGKRYPSRRGDVVSLEGVSATIANGERVAVIGASGAGKSTLLRLLNGTLRPSSGTLAIFGRDVTGLRAREARAMRRRIGTIYQQAPLVPSLTALDNTLCGALGAWSLWHAVRAAIAPPRAYVERAMAALRQVGLADKRDARADELSGGQQQRVAIARLIMQDPEVILADEPFSALDPALTDTVARLLGELAATGRSFVCTLHDVELALQLFPRVIALRDGRLAFDVASTAVTREMLDALYRGAPAEAATPASNSAIDPTTVAPRGPREPVVAS